MKNAVLPILAIFVVVALFCSCFREGDESDNDEEDLCQNNHPPQLQGPYVIKDNEAVDEREFSVNENIGIAIDFYDKDCNLDGGSVWVRMDGEGEFEPVVYIPSWANCEGYADTGSDVKKLGFNVRLQSGTRKIEIGLTDVCGKRSENAVSTTLTIVND